MWEEVEGLDQFDPVSRILKPFEVPDLGRGIAGHVDDPGGTEGEELVEKGGIAAFSWRIDDDGRFIRRVGDLIEYRIGFAEDK